MESWDLPFTDVRSLSSRFMTTTDLLYLAVQDQDVQEHLYVVHCELRFCDSTSLDQLL